MDFRTENVGTDIAVIRGDGRLNMVSAPHLREQVTRAINAGRNRIVVDLAATSFIDSSGLGALVGSLKAARQADGDLRIAAPNDQVRMVLSLSNVDRVLRSYTDPGDAFSD
ncbi:anti-sigma-factor antagonist [Labedella gwakjiensis]|uniref:Anti-sigma factor antagonist n=1 Tax=Labedella gwakjiensis TaxID=390269 RepID=A0A2P8GTW4_9MICO|nr:STAS domain-containing protein [Labedella gwakjiensis]PSL37400.1 anti-sigma-factor antagonist [Labedella gwakjiensis]RUQ84718.1 anti-sigma factor antagonist [Labedella gwakjiensis]